MKKYTLQKFYLTAMLLIMPVLLFAAGPGEPCSPDQEDSSAPDFCADAPLDTWVFLLVFLVLACTIWYYYKQKKSLRTL